jgi:hypothetical protein
MRMLMVLILLAMAMPVHAEWYMAGDMLHARHAGPTVDGTWKQDYIMGGSDFNGASLAWDAGVGYRFSEGERVLADNWSVELGYWDWGSATAGGQWVSDEQYGQVKQHGEQWLKNHDVKRRYTSVSDSLEGGYGRVAKGFVVGSVEPYVSVGWFGGVHTLRLANKANRVLFTGMVSGPTVGGGIKWHIWHGIKARAGAESHWSLTESGHPTSSHWLTVGGGLEVPLTGW